MRRENEKGRANPMAMSAEERQQMLLTQPVEKIIPKMALPTICSMLITSIYNMADTYFVSQIGTAEATASGTSASAAVGIVFSVMAMIQALAFMFGMGSGTNVSHLLGMGKRKEAEVYSAVGFFSAVAAGVLIAVLGNVFNEPLMRLLGATETAMPYALDYARYIFLAAPFMMGSLSMNNLLRFQGLATYGMVGIISGVLLNMLLDPLCVLLEGHALFTVLQRIMHHQPLACRRASAVNHDDFLIQVLRRKFLRRVRCGGISAGQPAGERNAKDILTLVQQLLEAFLPRRGIDGGGLNHHAAAELTISLLFRHFRRSRNRGNAIDCAGKRHDVEIMLCLHPRLRHVSGRIRNNIVHFCPPDVLWGSSAACRQRPPSLVSESGCADLETMQLCGRAKKETEALTSASCADTSNRKDAPRVTMHCMFFTRY